VVGLPRALERLDADRGLCRHARGHAYSQRHAIVQSMEPGEDWRWCHVDETFV
jgi:hypothetical protein